MKAPRNFRLTFTGDTERVIVQSNADKGHHLGYVLQRLFVGMKVDDDALASYEISVEVEDQGEG